MISADLLLKGLGGVAVVGGAATVGVCYHQGLLTFDKGDANLKELAGKVGLSCNGGTPSETSGIECTKTGTGETKVKQDSTEFNVSTLPGSNSGKIKVYKTSKGEEHKGNFKFVIEDGDIAGATVSGGSGSNKLEQFETYEITEESSKHYLTRKTEAKVGIKKALGIESCELPTDATEKTCSLDQAKIKVINFKDKAQDPAVTLEGNKNLKIHKTSDTNFPFGYKFVFESDNDISVPSTTAESPIVLNKFTDFKINKPANGNAITLEKAWTVASLIDKVGLSGCDGDNKECTIKTGGSLNVKHNTTKETGKTKKTNTSGKIKLHTTNSSGYREKMMFTIEDGDFEVESGSGTSITKLEQFETYEITEEQGTYYLTKKTDAKDEIKKALGLSDAGCEMPTTDATEKTCTLDEDKLKKINFDGKSATGLTLGSGDASQSLSLKIKVATTDEKSIFPHGYKFTLVSNRDITLDTSKVIKKGTNTEFKIKKNNGALSLEKAWSVTELGKKVGLNCTAGQTKECTLESGSIKVYNDGSKKTETGTKPSGEEKKITYQEDQEGHNQGFKFSTTSDIQVCNGSNEVKILASESSAAVTYEIGTKTESNTDK